MDEKHFQDTLSQYLLSKLRNPSTQHDFAVRLEILEEIANYLHLDIDLSLCTNAFFIQPEHRKIIDKKCKEILKNNFQVSQEELNIYSRFTYHCSIHQDDIIKIIEFLANHDYIVRDGHEKILKSTTLVSLLAVDGFSGYSFNCLTHYVVNLQTSQRCENNLLELHVKVVREMYQSDYLNFLSGNDAAALIFLALLQIYDRHVTLSTFMELCKNDVDNYLLKKSKSDANVKSAKENITVIMNTYLSQIPDIITLAHLKIRQFLTFHKNKFKF